MDIILKHAHSKVPTPCQISKCIMTPSETVSQSNLNRMSNETALYLQISYVTA